MNKFGGTIHQRAWYPSSYFGNKETLRFLMLLRIDQLTKHNPKWYCFYHSKYWRFTQKSRFLSWHFNRCEYNSQRQYNKDLRKKSVVLFPWRSF